MCGARIAGRPYRAIVDGVEMVLCASCYLKLTRSGRAIPVREKKGRERSSQRVVRSSRPRRLSLELYDIVEDYAERIRRAREERGWTLQVLAQKLRISESMLRKIEGGKMKPSIDLAKRIEKVLKIKILEPTELVDEDIEAPPPGTLTLGDVVVIRRDEE
jgi:putative transcription factor